jgi:autotransporter-associated beta strand protein
LRAGLGLIAGSVIGAAAGPVNAQQYFNGPQITPNGAINGGDGIWDNGTTNWANATGSVSVLYDASPATTTVFGASGSSTPATGGTVNVNSPEVQLTGSVQFRATGDNSIYTIQNGGLITAAGGTVFDVANVAPGSVPSAVISSFIYGLGGLTKTGNGTLVLSNANFYVGGTTISAGALQVTNVGAVGPNTVTLNGGTFQAGANNLDFGNAFAVNTSGGSIDTNGNTLTISGTVQDGDGTTGVLNKTGAGTLVLSGINAYSGGTAISAGVLQVTNFASVGAGDVTLNGGAFQADGFSDLNFANTFRVNTAGGAVDNNGTVLTLSGIIANGNGNTGVLQVTDSSGGFGTTVLSGVNTYTGGTLVSGAVLQVTNDSSVGSGTVTLDNGEFQADGLSDLTFTNNFKINDTPVGSAINANGVVLTLSGNITDGNGPGALTITDFGGGRVIMTGTNTYTGGTTICGCATLQLGDATHTASMTGAVTNDGVFDIVNANTAGITSIKNEFGGITIFRRMTDAGTMTIDNDTGGSLEFHGRSSAANATINNDIGSITTFLNNSTAGNATINNLGGFGAGLIEFDRFSTAGTATINNAGHSLVAFSGQASLDRAKIVNNDDGIVLFSSQSSAGTALALITNNDFGQVHFIDRSTAGSVTINNNGSGVLDFNNRSTAGDATIVNSSTIGMAFLNQSTAGNAFITTNNNSATYFFDRSDGGTARFETEAGSIVDFSLSRGPNNDGRINAGSIGGAGSYFIGANNTLITGGNNLSSEVSGVIADFDPCGCGPAGPGSLEKVGTGNLVLSGINTYTGATTVNGGILSVNGDITSSSGVTVNAGGTLGGNGIVGDTTINGGTLAPGNSIGLLTVQGSLVFTAAASYLVEVSPANADRTNVTGVATLGGATVNAHFAAGSYVARQYIILNATGGLGGSTFNALANTDLPANFSSSLSYDAKNVYLNLTLNFIPPPNSGLNVNQQNVGNAIVGFFNRAGGIPLVFGGLTPAGLSQVSGETATGTQQATFDAMNLFLGLLTDPFVAGRGDGGAAGGGATPYAEGASAYAASKSNAARDAFAKFPTKADAGRDVSFDQRWSVWGAAYGGGSTTDGNAALGSNTATARAFGLVAGADYRISPYTLAGFALAGGGTSFGVNGFGSGRSDLFQAGAFVRHTIGPAYVTAALAYGWQDVTTDRTVTVAGVDRLRAEFNANAWSGRVEGGYRFVTPWMGGVGVTPYAAGQFTTYSLPAYAEQVLSGANTFALNYAAKDVTASRSELGMRTDKSFAMQNGIFTLRGRAAWAHNFNIDRSITPVFQTLPGASFVVNGAAQAPDAALVTGSAEMKWLNGFSLAATFEGEFSDVTKSYAGKGVARYVW